MRWRHRKTLVDMIRKNMKLPNAAPPVDLLMIILAPEGVNS